MTCRCGADCRSIARAGLLAMDRETRRLLESGKLEQTCELCGFSRPAGGFCNCGHYPPISQFWRRTASKVQSAHLSRLNASSTAKTRRGRDSRQAA